MSRLTHQLSGRCHVLGPMNIVGRAPLCDLCLPSTASRVSRLHALIYWAEGRDAAGWWVRDLNSSNGTFIDGVRLTPGGETAIALGCRVSFGASDDEWGLTGEPSPPIVLIGRHAEYEVRLTGRLLLLPHDAAPEAIVYHRRDVGWLLDTDEGTVKLDTDARFDIAGLTWRAVLPDVSDETRAVSAATRLELRVSAAEDYVELWAGRGGHLERITGGTGNALYFVLSLARRRLTDASAGFAEAEQGWVHTSEAAAAHRCTPQTLNQWVFRMRARVAGAGYDEVDLIERRPRTGLMRLGHGDVSVIEGAGS